MKLDINDLYKLISESIQKVVKENFQYNLMEVFGDEEIQLELEDGKHINIYVNIESEEDLDVLDEFCCDYGWRPIKCKKGFNIEDTQVNEFVEEECYKTFTELVDRILNRAIAYYLDEMCWDEDDTESELTYCKRLWKLTKKYDNFYEEELYKIIKELEKSCI